MSDASAREVVRVETELTVAERRRHRSLRPWVLVCLLILAGAMAFAVGKSTGGRFYFDVVSQPGGGWVVLDKADRRSVGRERIQIAIGATGMLHRDWTLMVLDERGRPSTTGEFYGPALEALDRLETANARLEGTESTGEYQTTLTALHSMLSGRRNRYVENWLGMAVERLSFVLAPGAVIGLITCGAIAGKRSVDKGKQLERLSSVAKLQCPTCKYDVRGVPTPMVCPECGTDVEAVEREARAALE